MEIKLLAMRSGSRVHSPNWDGEMEDPAVNIHVLPEDATSAYIECEWVHHEEIWMGMVCRAYLPGYTWEFNDSYHRDLTDSVAQFLAKYGLRWHVSAQEQTPPKDRHADMDKCVFSLAMHEDGGDKPPEGSQPLVGQGIKCPPDTAVRGQEEGEVRDIPQGSLDSMELQQADVGGKTLEYKHEGTIDYQQQADEQDKD